VDALADTSIASCKSRTTNAYGFGKDCQTHLLGQLIYASLHLGNWPTRTTASNNFRSVSQVYDILRGIDLKSFVEKSNGSNPSAVFQDHAECNPQKAMWKKIGEIYRAIPSAVLDSHRLHMQEQWKKGNPESNFA
jgi:hypothetical protein